MVEVLFDKSSKLIWENFRSVCKNLKIENYFYKIENFKNCRTMMTVPPSWWSGSPPDNGHHTMGARQWRGYHTTPPCFFFKHLFFEKNVLCFILRRILLFILKNALMMRTTSENLFNMLYWGQVFIQKSNKYEAIMQIKINRCARFMDGIQVKFSLTQGLLIWNHRFCAFFYFLF